MQRLARFTDVTLSDPATFGGGSARAHVLTRAATVAYGYLGVIEEFEAPNGGATWCMLTVTMPGSTPKLAVDHRTAFGRPGVPAPGRRINGTGDRAFDAEYSIVADDPADVSRTLTTPVRRLLVEHPVQRFELTGGLLILRSVDGMTATDDTIGWLSDLVEGILSSTPCFVTPSSGRGLLLPGRPLAPGLHALEEPTVEPAARPERALFGGLRRGR